MSSIQEAIVRLCLPEVTRHASNEPHKENNMEYPEEIYATLDGGLLTEGQRSRAVAMWPRRHAYQVGYEAGKAEQADPLAGYSNLTEAIRTGKPIDWEELDGLKTQCVNTSEGSLRGVLTRNESLKPELPDAWWGGTATAAYINALYDGWHGKDGWSLWIEGEIPLRRKTADQLELGTYFLGTTPEKKAESLVYVGGWNIRDCKSIYHAPTMLKSPLPAEKWEVIEEYGPFQKPEGK